MNTKMIRHPSLLPIRLSDIIERAQGYRERAMARGNTSRMFRAAKLEMAAERRFDEIVAATVTRFE